MSRTNLLRTALSYTQGHRGARIVVKLGKYPRAHAEELGVFHDLQLLRAVGGIDIAVVEDSYSNERVPLRDPPVKCPIPRDIPAISCDYSTSDLRATELAIERKAAKLIYMTSHQGVIRKDGTLISSLTIENARRLLDVPSLITGRARDKVFCAIKACEGGVPRVHIISGHQEGTLLEELFTSEGCGTMIYAALYEEIRRAEKGEVFQAVQLLRSAYPSVAYERILERVENLLVFLIDGEVHGCMVVALVDSGVAEISLLAVSAAYEQTRVAQRMVEKAEEKARAAKCRELALAAETTPWWLLAQPWFVKQFKRRTRDVAGGDPLYSGRIWTKELL
ncbi:MAG: GNAT family N-acetyltransferase [Parcubacteria group bacterium]|nr:GNAT family N-acetyltransferase [Parcubacteria group bacterium]